jgi:hypothetical protein
MDTPKLDVENKEELAKRAEQLEIEQCKQKEENENAQRQRYESTRTDVLPKIISAYNTLAAKALLNKQSYFSIQLRYPLDYPIDLLVDEMKSLVRKNGYDIGIHNITEPRVAVSLDLEGSFPKTADHVEAVLEFYEMPDLQVQVKRNDRDSSDYYPCSIQ